MISLELAKKLKDAGLEWEPKTVDWFSSKHGDNDCVVHVTDNVIFTISDYRYVGKGILKKELHYYIWLPSLFQLLAEIEKRNNNGWLIEEYNSDYRIEIYVPSRIVYYGKTPEEAAGQALLWILEGEK